MSSTESNESSKYQKPVLSWREQCSYAQRERDRIMMEGYKRFTLRRLGRKDQS